MSNDNLPPGTFDTSNPPSQPDSDLNSDMSQAADYAIQGGTVNIAPGDWVDVDPEYINPDPNWGYSFQVCNMYPNAVGILVMDDPVAGTYSESQLSPMECTNNFRRVNRV